MYSSTLVLILVADCECVITALFLMLRQAESYFPLSSTPNVKLFVEIVHTGLLVHDSFITLAYSLELRTIGLVADCTSTGRTISASSSST